MFTSLRVVTGSLREAIAANASEIALGVAVLSGWASLTYGVRILVNGAAQRAVWPLSTGLLLVSACGWAFLGQIAARGLYVVLRHRKAS